MNEQERVSIDGNYEVPTNKLKDKSPKIISTELGNGISDKIVKGYFFQRC